MTFDENLKGGNTEMEKLKKVRTTDQSFANHKHTSMLFSPF